MGVSLACGRERTPCFRERFEGDDFSREAGCAKVLCELSYVCAHVENEIDTVQLQAA